MFSLFFALGFYDVLCKCYALSSSTERDTTPGLTYSQPTIQFTISRPGDESDDDTSSTGRTSGCDVNPTSESSDTFCGVAGDPSSSTSHQSNLEPQIQGKIKHNRNPEGHNQYMNCPRKDDQRIYSLLLGYHRKGIMNKDKISELLLKDHGITMSSGTVNRRRRDFNLRGSGATTRAMSDTEKRQLILDQMAKDPDRQFGPRKIKELIANETGVLITRDWIIQEMRKLDPEGFAFRHPQAQKARKRQRVS